VALLWLRANTHPVLPEFLSEAAAMPEPCVGADGGRRVELHTFTFRADARTPPRSPWPWMVAVRPWWSWERRSAVGSDE
jgi:hypothetical protein